MASLPELPGWIGRNGPWAASLHYIDYPENEDNDQYGGLEVVVVSCEEAEGVASLTRISLLQLGESGLEKPQPGMDIQDAPLEWVEQWMGPVDPGMDPGTIHDIFERKTARRLMSGHILALRYQQILRIRKLIRKENPTDNNISEIAFDTSYPRQEELLIYGEI